MLVQSLLEASARRLPDKTAVVCGDQRIRYAQLDETANIFAHRLRALGLKPGERVAIFLDNGIPVVTTLFAVWKAGAVALLVNPLTKADKLGRLLAHAEAAALISGAEKSATVDEARRQSSPLRIVVTVGGAAEGPTTYEALTSGVSANPHVPTRQHIDLDLAVLLYTSGSTGAPKGVMHSHQALTTVTVSIVEYLENVESDVFIQVLPMSFGYGLMQLLGMVAVGGTLVLERSFAFPQVTLKRMASEKVTGIAMVPTVATMMLESGMKEGGTHDLSSLRTITNAGAGMPAALAHRVRAALPHARLFLMYGQTECIRGSYLPPDLVDTRTSSVGTGIPNAELWLVDDDGRRLPPGSTGELVIRGAHIMRGYWKMEEETAHKLRPGPLPGERVLFTGDLFRSDPDGFLHFVSRKDDMIKTRGEKVSPKEVEDALCLIDGVVEAAVIVVADPLLGQAVKAFVRIAEGAPLDARGVQRAAAARLEDFAVPKLVVLMDALPRNINGKIDKQTLRAQETGA